jgi:4-hydroxyphenylpyruvate dioxygenase-like putative hemolysin
VGPCIHHFAIEVEDLPQAEQRIKAYGCEIISEPGGTVAELVPVRRYKPSHSQ